MWKYILSLAILAGVFSVVMAVTATASTAFWSTAGVAFIHWWFFSDYEVSRLLVDTDNVEEKDKD